MALLSERNLSILPVPFLLDRGMLYFLNRDLIAHSKMEKLLNKITAVFHDPERYNDKKL